MSLNLKKKIIYSKKDENACHVIKQKILLFSFKLNAIINKFYLIIKCRIKMKKIKLQEFLGFFGK